MAEDSSGSSTASVLAAFPPATERGLCVWARRALDEGRAAEALAVWEASGSPCAEDAAVSVALALLEAEAGRWAGVRARATRVAEATPDNLLAVGLAALGAYHEGAPGEAAALFARQGLFAAYPVVRLFVRTFALEAMRASGRFSSSAARLNPGVETDATSGATSGGAPNGDLPNGGSPNDGAAKPETTDAPARPGLWRRFVRGGGFGADSVSRAWVIEGDGWLMREEPGRALACFEAAGREDPKNWMARMAGALCRLEGGDAERASDDLLDLLGENPDIPNVASAAAWACLHRGEARRALDILATLAPAGPDDWGMYYMSAIAYYDLGKHGESDSMLRVALGPFFLDTWENFVTPLFHRVVAGLRAEADREGGRFA